MGHSCYVRSGGLGLIDVSPKVTLRFDQMHAITHNRVRKALVTNFCDAGWASKVRTIVRSLEGHHNVITNYLEARILNHPDMDLETLQASLLLIDMKLDRYNNPTTNYYRYGKLQYIGSLSYEQRLKQGVPQQTREVMHKFVGPIMVKLIDHTHYDAILHAVDNRLPYTFTGVTKR